MSGLFLLYAFVTTIFILSGSLIIVIRYLLNILEKNKIYKKDIESIRKDMDSHSQHLLDKARQEAHEIINVANSRAKEIISQTKILDEKAVTELLATQKEELEKARSELFKQYVDLFKNISKDIETKAAGEITDFKEVIEKETIDSQKILANKIEFEYDDLEKELTEYRNKELTKLRDNIYKITQDTIELAIGKTLDRDTHETLVMEALREAIENNKVNQES